MVKKQTLNVSNFETKLILKVGIALVIFVLIFFLHKEFKFSMDTPNFLGVHTVLEVFSIIISFSIALQSWHLSIHTHSKKTLFVGALFLCVGIFDLLHTMSYKGMPFFTFTVTGERATWFWITARLTEALSLLFILMMKDRIVSFPYKRNLFIGALTYTLLISTLILFKISTLPHLLDSQGVTPLKVGLEYLIGVLHLMSILLIVYLLRHSKNNSFYSPQNVLSKSLIALFFLLFGELLFTLYESVYDIENIVGHIYKCFGYYYLYKGILVESVQEPFNRVQQASAETQKYREELEHFFQLSLDALMIFNFSGKLLHWNPSVERILGYNKIELAGRPLGDLIHPVDKEKTIDVFQELTNGFNVEYFENRYLCRDGKAVYLAWSAIPLKEKGLIYALGKDITERKKIEQEIARFDRLNLVAEMAAGISHEVRNPMTTVRGFLQILQAKEKDSRNNEYYELMIEELDRANSIITEFLSLGKNRNSDFAYLDLNKIIKAIAPLIESDALCQDKNTHFDLTEVPKLYLDEKEIRQILLNLTRNGLEAMKSGGKLCIMTFLKNNKVVLSVQDQGSGIPASLLEKIGTPFMTTKESGTGLGLATCYSIAARHNAEIKIETGDSGTTVSVWFEPLPVEVQKMAVS